MVETTSAMSLLVLQQQEKSTLTVISNLVWLRISILLKKFLLTATKYKYSVALSIPAWYLG